MAVKLTGLSPKEAHEKRAQLIADARKLNEEHADDWGADHETQYGEMMADASQCKQYAERMTALAEAEGEAAPPEETPKPDPQAGPAGTHRGEDDGKMMIEVRDGNAQGRPRYVKIEADEVRGSAKYKQAFSRFLKTAKGQKGLFQAPDVPSSGKLMALQSDDAEQAGYLVASEQFASDILREVDDLVFIRQHAKIHTVREASSLGIRARTSRANTFDWSQELQVSTDDSSLKYGKRSLTPHHLTGAIKLSRDLVRRSVVSAEGEVRSELARDSGEKMEDGYMTGDGRQKPLGVFTPSVNGISTARDVLTGSATGITADALINGKYSMKAQYRNGLRGEVRWLWHRTAINKIALLKDSNNQYLFRVGMGRQQDTQAPEDMLLGYAVDESERCPNTFTTGQYVGLLANWNYYEIADALDMEIQVLVELYAQTNQYCYIGRLKTDGMPTLEEAFCRFVTN